MPIYWKDSFNLLKKLTFKRIKNAFKVLGSYYFSNFKHQSFHSGLPISIAFEPTTSCNLRCPECPSGLRSFTRPTGMLQEDIFRKTIDELASTLLYLTFYFQGEPYLHPKFLEMVQYANDKKIYTATSTNAHYLTPENATKTVLSGLSRLIISIDGTSQETYEQYRIGGKLSKVIEGTKNIIAAKKNLKSSTPHVIFQFLVVRPNEHQIAEVYELAQEIGVDEVRLKTAQIYDYENGNDLIPTIEKYSRYKKEEKIKTTPNPFLKVGEQTHLLSKKELGEEYKPTYSIKNTLSSECWKMWHSCVITWDGLVVPCCFDKDAHYRLGDMKKQTFSDLWKSAEYQNFRNLLLKSRSEIEMCKNCTEGTKVFA